MTSPDVSVILPVYNGERHVRAAIESILSQSFRNLELIVVDDGSMKDKTKEVLHGIQRERRDQRLKVITLETNIGLSGALNVGLKHSIGRYIARQDHDDISLPNRIEKQVSYLDRNPECGLLGTRSRIWIDNRATRRCHKHPLENLDLQYFLLFDNPFVHTSVMFRRKVFVATGGYSTDTKIVPPEDYELWCRMSEVCKVANLPDQLVIYREMPGSISREKEALIREHVVSISQARMQSMVGERRDPRQIADLANLMHSRHGHLSEAANKKELLETFEVLSFELARRYSVGTSNPIANSYKAKIARIFDADQPTWRGNLNAMVTSRIRDALRRRIDRAIGRLHR